jgi:hypothetical protein
MATPRIQSLSPTPSPPAKHGGSVVVSHGRSMTRARKSQPTRIAAALPRVSIELFRSPVPSGGECGQSDLSTGLAWYYRWRARKMGGSLSQTRLRQWPELLRLSRIDSALTVQRNAVLAQCDLALELE